jgi:hypothetical protein
MCVNARVYIPSDVQTYHQRGLDIFQVTIAMTCPSIACPTLSAEPLNSSSRVD